jgi:hypothetical protein
MSKRDREDYVQGTQSDNVRLGPRCGSDNGHQPTAVGEGHLMAIDKPRIENTMSQRIAPYRDLCERK